MTTEASPQLPNFLRLSRAEISRKFVEELHWDQELRLSQRQPASPWARPSSQAVTERNRYINIDPFQNNRIHLKVPQGVDDYINASPIVLRGSKNGTERKYIATQGPKESYHSHLWRMLWTETGPPSAPAVVIMLTQTHEAGREKCFQYYPLSLDSPILDISGADLGDEFSARVELLESTWQEETRATLRKMRLSVRERGEDGEMRGGEKIVWHYLFSGWPDFTVPEEPRDRAGLVELIRASARLARVPGATHPIKPASRAGKSYTPAHETQSPRVVHCSAGVGRSGTFIALDYLLSELEAGMLDFMDKPDADPIASTVDILRRQRMMMVQGDSQFEFLYEVLRDLWLERHQQ